MAKIEDQRQAVEDYLKSIYLLALEESPVSTSRIAEARRVRPPSVTAMVKRLDQQGLVNYKKHYGVTLTESGQAIALEMLRHHRLLERYLTDKLGFSWDEVHEEAEQLEHVLSDRLESRIAATLGHPEFDPHGEPIPAEDGSIPASDSIPLTEVSRGQMATVTRVTDDTNADLLCHLGDRGVVPGALLHVSDVAPFEGPITVVVGDETHIIGFQVATSVHVTVLRNRPDGSE